MQYREYMKVQKNVPRAPYESYSGENFDRITTLALAIADCERANGRAEPAYGYSRGDWLRAEETIKNSIR